VDSGSPAKSGRLPRTCTAEAMRTWTVPPGVSARTAVTPGRVGLHAGATTQGLRSQRAASSRFGAGSGNSPPHQITEQTQHVWRTHPERSYPTQRAGLGLRVHEAGGRLWRKHATKCRRHPTPRVRAATCIQPVIYVLQPLELGDLKHLWAGAPTTPDARHGAMNSWWESRAGHNDPLQSTANTGLTPICPTNDRTLHPHSPVHRSNPE